MRWPSRTLISSPVIRSIAVGQGVAVLGAVLFAADSADTTLKAIGITAAAFVVAALTARLASASVRRAPLVPVGVIAVLAACALLAVTYRGVITLPIAAILGTGIGMAMPDLDGIERRVVALAVVAGAVELTVCALIGGRNAALWCAAIIGVAVGLVSIAGATRENLRVGRAGMALACVLVLLAGGLMAWVAANDPGVLWFGGVISHGDRSQPRVALTFDDGPNAVYTESVARILDSHDVKGTFFQVGKAIDARPDITRALVADGQLVANHSYHHDSWRWLDPRYPELNRTQRAFDRAVGKCPAFFRPPHGQRTPFMLAQVRHADMHAVTWDTSAQDWAERNG
ncbi:MAG TPA: polysaccharide deacetylase family protein, partial [Acidimicrobiales bacterium]|nr:polysaccharide deacetylase family protein [Acidimicrobiales bacterium]